MPSDPPNAWRLLCHSWRFGRMGWRDRGRLDGIVEPLDKRFDELEARQDKRFDDLKAKLQEARADVRDLGESPSPSRLKLLN